LLRILQLVKDFFSTFVFGHFVALTATETGTAQMQPSCGTSVDNSTDDVVVVGTEEELSEFMAKHANVLTAADECEPLRDAGEAITDAFSSDPPRLYGELLLLCQKVVSASEQDDQIETSLRKVADEAMTRAKRKHITSTAGHTGLLTEIFQNTCINFHDQTSNWTVVASPAEGSARSSPASAQRRPSLGTPPVSDQATRHRQPYQSRSQRATTWQGPRKRGLFDRFLEAISTVSSSQESKKNKEQTIRIVAKPELVEKLVSMGFLQTGWRPKLCAQADLASKS
jgi:hypothetical protein